MEPSRCPDCGTPVTDREARDCEGCGFPLQALSTPSIRVSPAAEKAEFYFPVARSKLVIMSLCTFGFYEVYWFLKQWRFLRDSGEPDLKVLPRAIFSGLFAYPLFRRIRDHAKELDLGVGWDPGLLAAGYVLLALAFRLPGPLFLLGFSNVVFLLPVQQTMHRINSRYPPSPPPDHSYSGWNIATVMLGSILLFFVVVGSFLK